MNTSKLIKREDVACLFKDFGLLGIEVDERHIAMFNYMYALGIEAGKTRAKAAIEWRISGPMWAQFIDKDEVCQ
jgi:hypothetical protein